jgi:hypothetical protein
VSQTRDDRQNDIWPRLEDIINLRHPLVRLAAERLAVPCRTLRFGLSRRPGAAAAANTADGPIVGLQAHAHPLR